MAALYIDNDVSLGIAHGLRVRSHDVVTTRDLGHYSAADYQQLLTAARARRIFVTHN